MFGWKTSLVWPPEPRGVIVVYPHTSNWDFPIGVLFRIGHRLKANWVGKQEMFRWPLRGLFLRIGGIPLDRRKTTGFIDALLAEFRSRDWMWLAIAPEGTRGHTDHWKAGFYQIALAANVPVALAYIDYATQDGRHRHLPAHDGRPRGGPRPHPGVLREQARAAPRARRRNPAEVTACRAPARPIRSSG